MHDDIYICMYVYIHTYGKCLGIRAWSWQKCQRTLVLGELTKCQLSPYLLGLTKGYGRMVGIDTLLEV